MSTRFAFGIACIVLAFMVFCPMIYFSIRWYLAAYTHPDPIFQFSFWSGLFFLAFSLFTRIAKICFDD